MVLSRALRPIAARSLSTATKSAPAASATPSVGLAPPNAVEDVQVTAEATAARKQEMAKAAKAKVGGKSGWQAFVSGALDVVRPVAAAAWPTLMPIIDAPSQKRVRDAASIEDLRKAAEKRMHAMTYGYLAGGADEEIALRRSVSCYEDVELRHAVLHGVGHGETDLRTNIMGVEADLPFFVTSCAGQRMFHSDGEVATATAAAKHNVAMALSQLTTSTFEDVRGAAPNHAKILQLYVWRDRVLLKETVDAMKSPAWTYDFMSRVPYGYKAVPDADFPAESLVDFIAQQMKPEFDWKDAEWLCSEWGDTGKVALKGVARGEDAKRAVETGFDTVWVSNHGGRQLERSRAGADSVACGRAYLYGLAAGGEPGVDKALTILSKDCHLAMGLLGCRTVAELKERAPEILLVRADSLRRQGGIFEAGKAGKVLQPCLQ
ncbi:very-long-chain-(S)-2-hydroxy-acid oxidase [Aureococcus anophagefferens]|nr:very-long-chain-(S)-2-hydroxy-acid oxidase [Aureococcus anophagefferens]